MGLHNYTAEQVEQAMRDVLTKLDELSLLRQNADRDAITIFNLLGRIEHLTIENKTLRERIANGAV